MPAGTPHHPDHSEAPILDPDAIQQLRDLDESGDNTLLKELCDAFLTDAEERMVLIRQALAGMDMKVMSNTAHALKGGASNFGAKRFTTLCHTIQLVHAETTPAQAAELLASLEKEFRLLKEALQQLNS